MRQHSLTLLADMPFDRLGALTVQVREDGVGGADATRGSGLVGLRDPVEAVGDTMAP